MLLLIGEEDEDTTNHTKYCSIVGKAMYLTTKIRVEGSNTVQKLTKFFKAPQKEHWKALIHFVGYLKAQKGNIKLTI